jgi:PAS domain S-box-containing protein
MIEAPIPLNEKERIAALNEMGVLDTASEERFDRITGLAIKIFSVPISTITLVDSNREWFKSCTGLDAKQGPRSISFCGHALLSEGVFEITDASRDERFMDNPMVTGPPHIKFYAGVPLFSATGKRIGTFCIKGNVPKKLTAEELSTLRSLAEWAELELNNDHLSRALKEIKKEEMKYRESEEKFRQLADSINEVFWMTDTQKNTMLYISPGYEKIWARKCADLYANPRNWIEAIHSEDREKVLNAAITKQAAGTYDEQYRIIRPGGEVRIVHDRAFPIKNEKGEVYRIVGVAQDITENKKSEEELKREKEYTSHIVSAAPTLICGIKPDGTTTFVNDAVVRKTGYARDEVIGKNWWTLYYPGKEYAQVEKLFKDFEKGPVANYEMALTARNGEKKIVSWNSVNRFDEKGALMEVIGIGMDVTDSKMKEKQHSELSERINLLLESTDEGIYGLDLEGNCTLLNKSGAGMLGYLPEEMIGKSVHDLIHYKHSNGSLYNRLECPIINSLKTGGGIRTDSEVFWKKDGRAFDVEYSSYPIIDNGDIKGVVVVFTDITKRKVREQELIKLRKAVESSNEVIFLTDSAGKFTYVNPSFTMLYGYSGNEVIGKKTPRILKSGAFDDAYHAKFWGEILEKRPVKNEFINRTKDGKLITVESSVNPIIDDHGNVTGFLAIQKDITLQKEEQKLLREKTEELEKFNKFAVGRELKMIELKKRIKELEDNTAKS